MTLSLTWFYPLPLLFTVLWAEQRSLSGSHHLRYSFSFLSEPLPGVPQYSVVEHVDDVPIIVYTSESDRAGPRAPWMEKITDEEPQYWENSTETFEEAKRTLNDTLRSQMEQKNQASGLHVFQMILGCELCEDGSVKWFELFAYDGSNYTATIDTAVDIQNQGNSEELIGCIKSLKKLLKYGEESLRRRVTPQTMVSQRMSGDRTFLTGYAYGFYPREIEAKWVKDGVEIPWLSKEVLPNPDGTYQVRTVVEVQEGDDVKTYEYHVNHSSLLETVIVTYGPRGRSWQGRLLVLAVLVMTVVLVVGAVFLWKHYSLRQGGNKYQTSGDRDQEGNEGHPPKDRDQEGNEGQPPEDRDQEGNEGQPSGDREQRSNEDQLSGDRQQEENKDQPSEDKDPEGPYWTWPFLHVHP